MLKQLNIVNFTVFPKASFEFAPGLNVIVGENGTGKSHVLKLAYALIAANRLKGNKPIEKSDTAENNLLWQRDHAEKLINVFRAGSMENLMRTVRGKQKQALWVALTFDDPQLNAALEYREKPGVTSGIVHIPEKQGSATVCFMPTRELLTIYPGFVSLYENRYLEFEETYYETCLLLGDPPLRKPMTDLLSVLETTMGGTVILEGGRFYLASPEHGKMEMPLVAEGWRKLAMLAQLIAVGALEKGGYLFWDEPEANLNPRLVKVIAHVIVELARAGIQIFIATHSLFLLRELEILQTAENKPLPQRYFALKQTAEGVEVEQGNTVEDLQTLVLLDEELQQSDRYMALEP